MANIYGILTRFGDYFEVTASDEDDARSEAETQIETEGQRGDSVHKVEKTWDGDSLDDHTISCGFKGIRDDLAEIMANASR